MGVMFRADTLTCRAHPSQLRVVTPSKTRSKSRQNTSVHHYFVSILPPGKKQQTDEQAQINGITKN